MSIYHYDKKENISSYHSYIQQRKRERRVFHNYLTSTIPLEDGYSKKYELKDGKVLVLYYTVGNPKPDIFPSLLTIDEVKSKYSAYIL